MPIPSPRKHQSKKEFISSCLSSIYQEYKNNPAEAQAICFSKWKSHTSKATYVVKAGDDEYAYADYSMDVPAALQEKLKTMPKADDGKHYVKAIFKSGKTFEGTVEGCTTFSCDQMPDDADEMVDMLSTY